MKYYCVKQYDTTDCGAACLATICKQNGYQISITKIREVAGTDRQDEKEGSTMSQEIVKLKNITKTYHNKNVLDAVTFSVKKGSICGLVGENGAGKTTLIKIMAGLVFSDAGSLLFGEKGDRASICQARTKAGFIVETPYFVPDMTAYENLNMQRLQRGIKEKGKIAEVLKIVGLEDTGRKRASQFSLGMKQRLGIAIALLGDIELLVLDEPINGLDPQGIIDFRNMMLKLNREYGITIIISSHILSELALIASDYVFISKGKIVRQMTKEQLEAGCTKNYMLKLSGKTDLKKVIKLLSENNICDYELAESEISLEQYYLALMEESR